MSKASRKISGRTAFVAVASLAATMALPPVSALAVGMTGMAHSGPVMNKRHCMINVGTPQNPRWIRDPACGMRRG